MGDFHGWCQLIPVPNVYRGMNSDRSNTPLFSTVPLWLGYCVISGQALTLLAIYTIYRNSGGPINIHDVLDDGARGGVIIYI